MKNYKMKIDKEFSVEDPSIKGVIKVTYAEVPYIDEEFGFGELRLYINSENMNFGFLYLNSSFVVETRKYFSELFGANITDIGYSEWGMQNQHYVSFDVGKKFLKFWVDLVVKNSQLVNQE